MIIPNISKYGIQSEQTEEFITKWFTYTKDKFINHVDTLYYVVYPDVEDWNTDERSHKFVDFLRIHRDKAASDGESVPIFEDVFKGLEMNPFKGFQMYSFHFGIEDNFDIFVMPVALNKNTPAVFVQTRSYSLWTDGTKNSFDKSADCVQKVLESFGIPILKVQENRIDYAFHTNRIQGAMNFFPEKDLTQMQISNFKCGSKRFWFRGDEVLSDYFTLGRRTSDNVFIRIYDKTKEVIELGYKQFFISLWREHGLISEFDVFVLDKAYNYGTYNSKERARCEFYNTYGKNLEKKLEISELLLDPDTPYQSFKKLADGLVPDITDILNIEFQVKRKYYDRLEKPEISGDNSFKSNIYNLFAQHKALINRLTYETIRFVKYKGKYSKVRRSERPMTDWWERLRSSKTVDIECDEWLVDYLRKEQKRLDFERTKNALLGKAASAGAFLNPDNGDLITDFFRLLSLVNDNDYKKYRRKREIKIKEYEKRGLL